jgi:ATP-dependent DNA ligase
MKVMKHSTLYRQNSKGTLQQWTISVRDTEITTEYGLVGGKLQTTVDIVKKGKNIGRSNETTAIEQAFVETQQQFDAKVKEGYQPDQSLALTTKNTLEAVECMLAHPIENKMKYVKFPGLAQPKLDGARCLAIMKKGKVKLWSRTQKQWVASPHIVAEIESIYGYLGNTILDGELYNHAYKNNFNYIMSLIKREDVHPDHKAVQYHIYDVIDEGNWKKRTAILNALVPTLATYCVKVETVVVNSQDELEQYQAQCVENGYEGCIYRNPEAPYEHKRSSGLLKVKSFKDDEFEIVDVEEGRGKLMGKVGAFYLLNAGGQTFKAKPMGTLEHVGDLWKNRKSCIGKMATVKYQNLTPDGMPRFPVLKCIRDYE